MRIAIDGRYIQDHFPGIGRYTYNLIRALAGVVEQDTVVVIHNPRLPNTRFAMADLGRLPYVEMVTTAVAPFSLAEQWLLPRLARQLDVDVWHSPYYICPYCLPCPLVVTVYDAISSHYPQYLPSLAARFSYEVAMRLAMTTARRVIAISQVSRADLIRFFAVPAAKVSVIAGAAEPRYRPQPPQAVAELRARLGLSDAYVLYVGSNKPHKNIVRLVEAWAIVGALSATADQLTRVGTLQAASPATPPQLVIAGHHDPRYPQAQDRAQQLGVQSSVRFLGAVAEADLPVLYSGAAAFVFPSLYEGFGLPALEAMACGVPVICSNTPALLEVVGDAALTVNPLDTNALAQAIARLLHDSALRHDLGQRSLKQASHFSWQRAAQEALAAYQAARTSDRTLL